MRNSLPVRARPVSPENMVYASNVAIMAFTRPYRSLTMPKMMPPVAQPIINANVARALQEFTTASVTPLPNNSRMAGSRASRKIRCPMQSNSQQPAAMINTR